MTTVELTHEAYLLVSYSLTHLSQTEKVKFYYALKGRGNTKGIIEKTGALSLGRSVFLEQVNMQEEIQKFLTGWNCNFHLRKVYLSPHQLGQLYHMQSM